MEENVFVINRGRLTQFLAPIGEKGYHCVTIPGNVKVIGQEAFRNRNDLGYVTIPGKVTTIGKWAFGGCECLFGAIREGQRGLAQ